MAPDADPRTRGTVFRTALETLGIPAIEYPRDPVLTPLQAGTTSVAFRLEEDGLSREQQTRHPPQPRSRR